MQTVQMQFTDGAARTRRVRLNVLTNLNEAAAGTTNVHTTNVDTVSK